MAIRGIFLAAMLVVAGVASAQVVTIGTGTTENRPQVAVYPAPLGYQTIRVTVTPERNSVYAGDAVAVNVRTSSDAHLYVYATDPHGVTRQLLPNYFERDHFVRANQTYRLPSSRYGLTATGSGWNTIHVVAIGTDLHGWNPPIDFYPRLQGDPFPIFNGGVGAAREALQRSLPTGPDARQQYTRDPTQPVVDPRAPGYILDTRTPLRQPGGTTTPIDTVPPKPGQLHESAPQNMEPGAKPLQVPETEESGAKPLQLQQQGIVVSSPGQPLQNYQSGSYSRWGEGTAQIYVRPRSQFDNDRPWVPAPGQPIYPYEPTLPGNPYSPGPWGPPAPGVVIPDSRDSGTVQLSSSVRGEVYIDNVFYGYTPLTVRLPVGRFNVRVIADGYRPYEKEVTIRRDRNERISVRLQRETRTRVQGSRLR